MENKLQIIKFNSSGKLQNTYGGLLNMLDSTGALTTFSSNNIKYDFSSPLDIEFQNSYDDSVNLILNNGLESPKLINSRFAKLENNTYEFINRNQGCATNIYDFDKLDNQTDLFLRSFKWPIFDLKNVGEGGQLMCGNYIFYIKYADEDDNVSDIVSESGTISIFSGKMPSSIHGNLLDFRTSKLIRLNINNIDTNYSKFYLFYTRETSDINGISLTKCYKIVTPYNINSEVVVTITGYEPVEEISLEELNIQYNYYNSVKTQATVQNMLFFGNVTQTKYDSSNLSQISYYIDVTMEQKVKSIGYINTSYETDPEVLGYEYYEPKNIYYYLGYWPEEYYQLGVVYLLNDGTTTKAYPLRGRDLSKDKDPFFKDGENISYSDLNKFEVNKLLNPTNLENTGGVFKTPSKNIFNHTEQTTNPLFFKFSIDSRLITLLKNEGVQGLMFVRTKRTPVSLFQGFSCGVDKLSGLISPCINTDSGIKYVIESFLVKDEEKTDAQYKNKYVIKDSPNKQLCKLDQSKMSTSALLAIDPIVVPSLQTALTWNNYKLQGEYTCVLSDEGWSRTYKILKYDEFKHNDFKANLVYIPKDIPAFFLDNFYFSTRAGNAESVLDFSFAGDENKEKDAGNIIRGVYCPIIGTNKRLIDSAIYTVKIDCDEQSLVTSLLNNNTEYYSITNRIALSDMIFNEDGVWTIDAYRGDCFTTTTTIRINRNFVDPTFPANDTIVDPETWAKNYVGLENMISTSEKHPDVGKDQGDWTAINLGDINNARLGRWITFKTLSNYNLGLRTIDKNDISTLNTLGTYRSFYPINKISTRSANKVDDSELLNEGYSITLSRKKYAKWLPMPYENFHFDNRIAFSNIASTKMFVNGYRIFQGMSYQDIDRQFGSIVKLMPYAQNLLCVFEHGIGIIPINEKALLSTQEGLSIHLYGSGVLQEQISVISPDFGSTWPDSIIKTPDAFYGVDSFSKKIWKFNNTSGFVCISDFKIQSYLNEIDISNIGQYFLGTTNIKTHYNNFNGDVIFTFYSDDKNLSITYNERSNMWVSRNTWLPLLSTNINSDFYSYDRKTVSSLSKILKQTLKSKGIFCSSYVLTDSGIDINYVNEFFTDVKFGLKSLKYFSKEENSIITKTINTIHKGKLLKYNSEPIGVQINNENYFLQNLTFNNELNETVDTIIDGRKCAFIYNNKLYVSGEFAYSNIPIEITLSAYTTNNDTVIDLEEYTMLFTNKDISKFTVSLYKHDINSPITTWYEKQEPFEFEFIVNQPAGFHKIFNNLMIISNNVEPESLEVEIIGDSYDFKEEFIKQTDENIKYKFPIISLPENKIYQTKLTLDKVTNEHRLLMHQDCLNIKNFGRRLGNISYIEGKWYIVLQPIYYEDKTLKTTRLRDKWAKIRIKYSGEKLAIITAIQTLMNISYV